MQRPWIIFADNRTFYLFTWPAGQAGDTQTISYYSGCMFGDIHSYVSGDAYACMAIGRTATSLTDTATNDQLDQVQVGANANTTGHYMARGYNQLGTSVQVGKCGRLFDTSTSSPSAMGNSSALPYPNPGDGKLWLSRAYVVDSTTAPTTNIRGFLRGFWVTQSGGSVLPLEYTINGSGSLSGRTFRVLGLRTGGAANGRYTMETSDTWD